MAEFYKEVQQKLKLAVDRLLFLRVIDTTTAMYWLLTCTSPALRYVSLIRAPYAQAAVLSRSCMHSGALQHARFHFASVPSHTCLCPLWPGAVCLHTQCSCMSLCRLPGSSIPGVMAWELMTLVLDRATSLPDELVTEVAASRDRAAAYQVCKQSQG